MVLPYGLGMRLQNDRDAAFVEQLHRSTRDDLLLVSAEPDFIEMLIAFQYSAQTAGHGGSYPNAMYFIVEKMGESVGRLTLDFGQSEIRIVNVALIPQVRGKGFGAGILQALQVVADQIKAPLTLAVDCYDIYAKRLYLQLGFQTIAVQEPTEVMAWYPQMDPCPRGSAR